MKALSLGPVIAGVCLAGCLVLSATAARAAQLAQDPTPIQSETSVQWVPLARINPANPVTIALHNKTAEPLEYLLTTHTDFRTLAPGETVSLILTDVPTFLNINAKRSVGVKYGLKINGNTVMVDLNLTSGQGDTTLNVHETGAIYLY
jgi:hypothetical protein